MVWRTLHKRRNTTVHKHRWNTRHPQSSGNITAGHSERPLCTARVLQAGGCWMCGGCSVPETHALWVGMLTLYNHLEELFGVSYDTKLINLPNERVIPVSGTHPRERKRFVHRKSLSHIRYSSRPKCPSAGGQINSDMHTMDTPPQEQHTCALQVTHRRHAEGEASHKRPRVIWFHVYEIQEQATLTYGDRSQKAVVLLGVGA